MYWEIEDLNGWYSHPHVLSIPGREEQMRQCAKSLAAEASKKNQEVYTVREVSNGLAKIVALAHGGVVYEPVGEEVKA